MAGFAEKIKILYLILVIMFIIGVLMYLFDTWGIIKLEEKLPFLRQNPPVVPITDDSPTLLELERIKKEKNRLEELQTTLKEKETELSREQEELQKLKLELEESRSGIEEEKKRMEETRLIEKKREDLIKNMSGRLNSMPPDDAIRIMEGWSNTDLVEVLRRMEKDAVAEGKPSIVPFLLTKLPAVRARVITTLMMDAEASRQPEADE